VDIEVPVLVELVLERIEEKVGNVAVVLALVDCSVAMKRII
jgi:hypothetical protein